MGRNGMEGVIPGGADADRSLVEAGQIGLRTIRESPANAGRVAAHFDTAFFHSLQEKDLIDAMERVGPELAGSFIQRIDATHRIVAIVPQDGTEFRRVFGRSPTSNELSQVSDGLHELQMDGGEYITAKAGGEMQLQLAIAESDQKFVTIVGHNDEGVLKFPDGSEANIVSVAELCEEMRKKCIFLSCDSEKFLHSTDAASIGIGSEISYLEAALVAKALDTKLRARRLASLAIVDEIIREEVSVHISAAIASRRIGAVMKPISFASSIGGLVYSAGEIGKE
jgi:hypothetical protein